MSETIQFLCDVCREPIANPQEKCACGYYNGVAPWEEEDRDADREDLEYDPFFDGDW